MPVTNVALGVGGGIAAYKAAELARALMARGFSVQVLMTRSAEEFVRLISCAMAAAPGTSRCEGTVINSIPLTIVTCPSGGGTSRPTNPSARFALGDESKPTTSLRTRCGRLTTSTAHWAPRTTPRRSR